MEQGDRSLFMNNSSEGSDEEKPLSKVLKSMCREGRSSEGNVRVQGFQERILGLFKSKSSKVYFKGDWRGGVGTFYRGF